MGDDEPYWPVDRSKDGTEGSPFAEGTAKPPRLSILHLMIVTFWTGIVFAVLKAIEQFSGDFLTSFSLLQSWGIFQGLMGGIALAGLTILIVHRRQHGPPLIHAPGHWLVLATAWQLVAYGLMLLMSLVIQSYLNWFQIVIFGVVMIGDFVVNVLAARWCRGTKMWRILFIARAVLSGAQFVSQGMMMLAFSIWNMDGTLISTFSVIAAIPQYAQLAMPVWLLTVVVLDCCKTRRDWIHWMGVALVLSSSAFMVVFYVVVMLAPQLLT